MAYAATTDRGTPGLDNPNILHMNAASGSEHPERKEHETFLLYGNTTTLAIYETEGYIQSIRRGATVIDDFGNDLTDQVQDEFFPIFADTEELRAIRSATLEELPAIRDRNMRAH